MPLLHEVVSVAHGLWPLAGAEDWDSPGLAVGRNEAAVSRILLAVDAVHSTVHEAVECGADVLLTHHPLLFRGVTTVAEETYKGHLIAELIRGGVALLSCHTNADVVADGVSDVIAQKLGLTNTSPIAAGASPDVGIGRVGDLIAPEYLGSLARRIATIFPATATGIRVAGEYSLPIKRVALCGGAGDAVAFVGQVELVFEAVEFVGDDGAADRVEHAVDDHGIGSMQTLQTQEGKYDMVSNVAQLMFSYACVMRGL